MGGGYQLNKCQNLFPFLEIHNTKHINDSFLRSSLETFPVFGRSLRSTKGMQIRWRSFVTIATSSLFFSDCSSGCLVQDINAAQTCLYKDELIVC
jgi:hypothetical protein